MTEEARVVDRLPGIPVGGDDITQALCDWRPGDDMQVLVDAADEIARLRCDLYDRRARTELAGSAIAETVAVLVMTDEDRRRIDLALLDLDRLARGLTTTLDRGEDGEAVR